MSDSLPNPPYDSFLGGVLTQMKMASDNYMASATLVVKDIFLFTFIAIYISKYSDHSKK
jgi:hypothetical protein